MAAMKVEHYDEKSGTCRLRDEHGRTFSARCAPTGRNRNQNQNERGEQNMQTETFGNAGVELDSKVKVYAAQHRCSYKEAFDTVKGLEPALYQAYAFDETPLDREVRKGSQEFSRRVVAYQDEWNLSRDEA